MKFSLKRAAFSALWAAGFFLSVNLAGWLGLLIYCALYSLVIAVCEDREARREHGLLCDAIEARSESRQVAALRKLRIQHERDQKEHGAASVR